MKGWNISLASKTVSKKPYNYISSLPIYTHRWKNLSIILMTGLSYLTNEKRDNFDFILIIINRLIKIAYNKLMKIIINTICLAYIMINMIIRHHGFLNSIMTNKCSFFTSKFWSLLYYFLGINSKFLLYFIIKLIVKLQNKII